MADDLRKKASRGSFFGKGKKEHTVARFTWNVDDPSFCSPQTMSLILKFLYADDNTFHGILSEQKRFCFYFYFYFYLYFVFVFILVFIFILLF